MTPIAHSLTDNYFVVVNHQGVGLACSAQHMYLLEVAKQPSTLE